MPTTSAPSLQEIQTASTNLNLNLGPWSYSKLKLFENCPRLFQAKYLTRKYKEPGVQFDSIPSKVGTFIHAVIADCLEKGVDKYHFNTVWIDLSKVHRLLSEERDIAHTLKYHAQAIIVKLEAAIKRYQLNLFLEKKICISGLLAYIDFLGITSRSKSAIVLDHKTHKSTPERLSLVQDQLSFYALCVFMQYPSLHFIQAGCSFVPDEKVALENITPRTDLPDLLQAWGTRLNAAVTQIQEGTFPAKKGPACAWCKDSSCALLPKKNR